MSRLNKSQYKTLLRLMNLYPAIADVKPLAIGVHKGQRVPLRPVLHRLALHIHCRRMKYVQALTVANAERCTFDGDPVSHVSAEDRKSAIASLKDKQGKRGKPKPRKAKTKPPAAKKSGPTITDEINKEAAKKRPKITIKKRRKIEVPA